MQSHSVYTATALIVRPLASLERIMKSMRRDWEKLDNAAKIYPSTQIKSDTHVFRFSCELNEDIEPDILQHALLDTIEIFDLYQVILKRGVFWYYLESSDKIPMVSEEYSTVCGKLYDIDKKTLLLEVTYFHRRINLEMSHILTDGTGGINFIRTLVCKYLSMKLGIDEPALDYNASRTQMKDDSFNRYYSGSKSLKRSRNKPSCQLSGPKFADNRLRVITGHMSSKSILDIAHEHGCTMTVYLSSCLVQAIADVLPVREKKKPVTLCVPVNLRKYFPSESIRNFFATLYIPYVFSSGDTAFDGIVSAINEKLKENLTEENLVRILDGLSAAENNFIAKIVPLRIKDFSLRRIYKRNLKNYTATLSNVGIITMPDVFRNYIHSFNVTIGTSKMHICVCTYSDKLSISFSTPFRSSEIERRFFSILTNAGVEVEITANDAEGQEDS